MSFAMQLYCSLAFIFAITLLMGISRNASHVRASNMEGTRCDLEKKRHRLTNFNAKVDASGSTQDQAATVEGGELDDIKTLYHKLHHLERFPEVLHHARETLLRLLAESLEAASDVSTDNILAIECYEEKALEGFINNINDRYCELWHDYIARRQAGGLREMFKTQTDAVAWLRDQAPVKFVDGAWLGHLHRFSAAFDTRSVTKNAWQVMSEEIGDGDLAKNHAHLYLKLVSGLGIDLPSAEDEDFIHARHGLSDLACWRSAVAQLLISLFPNDFLPEILGFNLHFELLTWHTLCATKELRELGIDDYYFVLHVSIDNAHSGHAAMSTRIVVDYMNHIHETSDAETARQIWKRVQAGYALWHCVSVAKEDASVTNGRMNVWNAFAEQTLRLFQAKAMVSQKLHCTSKASIGGRSLVEWLDPLNMRSTQHGRDFMDALSRSRGWIKPGNGRGSRLMQAMLWQGRMFGAFSDAEMKTISSWIDHLTLPTAAIQQRKYWDFTGRNVSQLSSLDPIQQDILTDYPVLDSAMDSELSRWLNSQAGTASPETATMNLSGAVDLDRLLPLWFAQTAQLEAMITVPMQTCNERTSALVHVVRAHRGFQGSSEGCAGMDELWRYDKTSLYDLGRAMMAAAGRTAPKNLREVFDGCSDNPAAINILHLSMRPLQYEAALVGMSWAFAWLHQKLGASDWSLLLHAHRRQLKAVSEVEFRRLREWWAEGSSDASVRRLWACGYEIATREIEMCFHE